MVAPWFATAGISVAESYRAERAGRGRAPRCRPGASGRPTLREVFRLDRRSHLSHSRGCQSEGLPASAGRAGWTELGETVGAGGEGIESLSREWQGQASAERSFSVQSGGPGGTLRRSRPDSSGGWKQWLDKDFKPPVCLGSSHRTRASHGGSKMTSSYPEQLAQAMRHFVPSHFFCHLPVPERVDWTPATARLGQPADGLGRGPDPLRPLRARLSDGGPSAGALDPGLLRPSSSGPNAR
jgi:hypothetical protein